MTSPGPVPRSWLAAVAGVALLAAAAGVLNQFANDDLHIILSNDRLHTLANWRLILGSPYWPPPFSPDLYRPLTSLLLAVEWMLGHGDPLVFRLVSAGLYAGTAVLLLQLGSRILPGPFALAAALLFAVHPVHVEAVALAVGQAELLVALASLAAVIRYLDARRRGDGRLSVRDWAVLGLLYLAAALSKEHGLVLPGLLLVVELCLLAGPWRPRLGGLAPGYASLLLLGLGMLALRSRVLGGVAGSFTAEALAGVPFTGRLLTLLQLIPEWLRLFLWPAHLRADYSPREFVASTGLGPREILGLGIAAVAVPVLLARRRAPAAALGVVWAAVALFPVSNVLVPSGVFLAERTLFLASVGAVLGAAALAAALAPPPRWLGAGVAVLVLFGLARSIERQRVWRNDAILSVRTVQDAPRSFRAQRAYGDLLFDLGQRELAEAAYRDALALAPPGSVWRVRNDLARRYRAMGETGREVEQLRAGLAENPAQDDARGYLVSGLLLLGKYPEAAAQADTAMARGGAPEAWGRARALADSAARVAAPPGSIKVRIRA